MYERRHRSWSSTSARRNESEHALMNSTDAELSVYAATSFSLTLPQAREVVKLALNKQVGRLGGRRR